MPRPGRDQLYCYAILRFCSACISQPCISVLLTSTSHPRRNPLSTYTFIINTHAHTRSSWAAPQSIPPCPMWKTMLTKTVKSSSRQSRSRESSSRHRSSRALPRCLRSSQTTPTTTERCLRLARSTHLRTRALRRWPIRRLSPHRVNVLRSRAAIAGVARSAVQVSTSPRMVAAPIASASRRSVSSRP